MKHWRIGLVLLLSALLASTARTTAQEKKPPKKPDTFTNAEEAGAEFKVQGEYVGAIDGGLKLGCQVIALGDQSFQVVVYPGGLPGDGWDGMNKILLDGKSAGDQTAFQPAAGKKKYMAGSPTEFAATSKFPPPGQKDYTATLRGELLTGKTDDAKAFELKKVFRKSPTVGARPPTGAVILFDGSNADEWKNGKIVEDNLLNCGTDSKRGFGLGKLHLEFRTPFQPKARSQGRGNSGVYVMGEEVQVLDSFGLNGENNECGGLYGRQRPAVNMCFPPLSWQTYDIEIKPGAKEGELLATVHHNGVKVHENFVIKASAEKPRPINLQNHGNPVVYRNIWMVPGDGKTEK